MHSPDPDGFQNLTATSLSNDTPVTKFSRRSNQFFQRYGMWVKT